MGPRSISNSTEAARSSLLFFAQSVPPLFALAGVSDLPQHRSIIFLITCLPLWLRPGLGALDAQCDQRHAGLAQGLISVMAQMEEGVPPTLILGRSGPSLPQRTAKLCFPHFQAA